MPKILDKNVFEIMTLTNKLVLILKIYYDSLAFCSLYMKINHDSLNQTLEKRKRLDKKAKVNFKMSQPRKQTTAVDISPNFSRSKGNQTMKFGQLTEYNVKIYNVRLVLEAFLFFKGALCKVAVSPLHYISNFIDQIPLPDCLYRYWAICAL